MRRTIERYELCDRIASGGMGSVHLGHLHGSAGFRRIVAIKRMHPELTSDPDFVQAFIEEARLAARIRHPNVVPILDALSDPNGEFFLVLDYVHGEALHRLLGTGQPAAFPIVAAIGCGMLEGLHAAHNAFDERGMPLEIIHRDVSPQNVLVGADGHARILDFGVATASRRARGPAIDRHGKLSYMAPEQIISGEVSPRSDIYSASVVLWEALTGHRIFPRANSISDILDAPITKPSLLNQTVPPELDEVVMRGLHRNPALRFSSAREMADRIESAVVPATDRELGEWVNRRAGAVLRDREERIARIERNLTSVTTTLETPPPAFEEFDGGLVTKTRSSPMSIGFAPNAILTYPKEIDSPGSEPIVVTTKRMVTNTTLELLMPDLPQKRRPTKVWIASGLAALGASVGIAALLQPKQVDPPPTAVLSAQVVTISDVIPKKEPSLIELREVDVRLPEEKKAPAKKRAAPKKRVVRVREKNPCDPPFWIDGEGLRRLKPGCD